MLPVPLKGRAKTSLAVTSISQMETLSSSNINDKVAWMCTVSGPTLRGGSQLATVCLHPIKQSRVRCKLLSLSQNGARLSHGRLLWP